MGGLFPFTLSYPKLQPEGCGELHWDAVGPQDTQRRWRSCSRLLIQTKGLLEWKQSTLICLLLPGLGVCSLCASTRDVFAGASPALPFPAVASWVFSHSQCLRKDLGGGFALFLSSWVSRTQAHPSHLLALPSFKQPCHVKLCLVGFPAIPPYSQAALGDPSLGSVGCMASPPLAQHPLCCGTSWCGEQMGRWSRAAGPDCRL